jgi:hypothetical protein
LISGDAVAGIPSINNKTKTIEKKNKKQKAGRNLKTFELYVAEKV